MPLLDQNDLTRILRHQAEDAFVYLAVRVGSQVYGTATPESDTDFIVVGDFHKLEILFGQDFNVTLMPVEEFKESLSNQSVYALEALFAPEEHCLIGECIFAWKLDVARLRDKTVSKSDSDWNKGLKLMGHETDKARKKIWHSLRIPLFAQQLVRDGSITDYGAANGLFMEIMTEPSEDPADYVKYDAIRQETLASLVR